MLSRAFAAILVLCLATAVAVPGFAAGTDVVTSSAFADSSHPKAFFTAKTKSAPVINQFTTGAPGVNTPLTTWKWTNHTSQWFERAIFTANGSSGDAWCVYSNSNLVINCARVSGNPEVNLANAKNNYRADIEIISSNNRMGVAPRAPHTTYRYITLGAALNGGNYLNWTTAGTNFYEYDISWDVFA